MLHIPTRPGLNRIVILNPKGGCGKTTLATNLASHYARRGPLPTLMDCDPQGSSSRWLERRPKEAPPIHGIAARRPNMRATLSWQMRVPLETDTLIIDSPAGLDHDALRQLTRDATSILIPVMPSAIDIHATARFFGDLLLVAKVDRRLRNMAVVGNRTRRNTRSFASLSRFLDSLEIPVIAALRDAQAYVQAAEEGLGICEMKGHRVKEDVGHFDRILEWLDCQPYRQARAPAELRPAGAAPG